MAVTPYGTPFTALNKDGGGRLSHPHDSALEVITATPAAGTITKTMLTDTSVVGRAAFAIPSSRKASAPSAHSVPTCAATVVLKGGNDAHDVFIIGGHGVKSFVSFALPAFAGNLLPRNGLVWEMVKGTLAAGVLKVVAADDLQVIRRIAYAFAIEIKSSAPTTGGIGVSELTTIDVTFISSGTESFIGFIGGYPEGATVADDAAALDAAGAYRGHVFNLLNINEPVARRDLIFEVVEKTLDAASPSKVTITAASDCQKIAFIEAVIPISEKTSGLAIAWNGAQGATAIIYSANAEATVARCLVIGR